MDKELFSWEKSSFNYILKGISMNNIKSPNAMLRNLKSLFFFQFLTTKQNIQYLSFPSRD